ncbi:sn-glycerol-3-phosphate ABC transporter ATP-binding protein UgpC [Pseudaeromonas sp. ZJS20]|uniref:ABC transporter ATP-binding protein n=1 Tax=Pseudaeromonas aegiceratis TaxID=3153928 RepID=UPI00390CA168
MASIQIKNLVKRYDKAETIRKVDLQIDNGEFVVFVGPSGCGKSTLLRMIAGLESISGGELYIDDQLMNAVAPAERGVAMVFQSYALYPHLNVAQNMGFGLKMNGVDKQEIAQRVLRAAKTLQMEALLDRKPKDMSGGQRQRVAIGRAIVRNPKVFLFDEPLSNLDAELRVEMRLQIAKLHHELGNTMIYVTHDQVEAMTLADKIVVLRAGQIEQVGDPLTLYHAPANLFVAGFIGSPKMNFLPARFVAQAGGRATVALEDAQRLALPARDIGLASGAAVTLGIRPEHISLEPVEGYIRIPFQSEVVERLGNATYLFGNSLGTAGVKIHLPGDKYVKLYEELPLYINPADCHLFDPDGQAFAIRQVPVNH